MFSIFNLKKAKYLYIFLLITLFTLGIFFLTQSTQAKPSSKATREGVFNPKIDWFYLRTSNDITVYMGKMFSKLPTIRYEKGGDHLQFSMTGISHSDSTLNPRNLQPTTHNLQPISSTTAVTLETNVKTPNEPVLFYRRIDKDIDVIYRISNIPLKVKEEIVLQSIKSIKLKVESQNNHQRKSGRNGIHGAGNSQRHQHRNRSHYCFVSLGHRFHFPRQQRLFAQRHRLQMAERIL